MPDLSPGASRTAMPLALHADRGKPERRQGPEITAKGAFGCVFCAHLKFRRSRVRIYDLTELLMLRYPMRCMRCNQRQYGYFLTAAFALPAKSQGTRVAQGAETWKAWTEGEMNGHKLQRPMTTSIGTRAGKLQQQPARPDSKPPQEHQPWHYDDRQIW